MRFTLACLALVSLAATAIAQPPAAPASAPEKRCGWLDNPTPGNWWLVDRQGSWTLGEQGGYQAPGMDDMPDMSTKGQVRTNGSYGYSCACMTVTTNPRTKQITRLISATPMPLRTCRADPKLKRPS